MDDHASRTALPLGVAATVLVGSSVAAASVLTDYPVLSGQAVRYAVSSALLVGYARVRGVRLPTPSPTDLVWLAGVAATGMAAFNVLLVRATAHADASIVGVVVGTTPIVLALVGARGRPAPRVVVASVVVVAGGVIVQQASGRMTALGAAFAIGAMIGEVCFSLLAVPPLRRLGPFGVSVHATWLAAVMLAVAAAVIEGPAGLQVPTAAEGLALAHMAVLVTAVGFVCWYSAVHRLGADRAGLLLGVIPVSALVTAAAVGTDRITIAKLAGVVIVAAGIALGAAGRGRPAGPEPAPPARLPYERA